MMKHALSSDEIKLIIINWQPPNIGLPQLERRLDAQGLSSIARDFEHLR
jgi:hypothetical protein